MKYVGEMDILTLGKILKQNILKIQGMRKNDIVRSYLSITLLIDNADPKATEQWQERLKV